MKTRTKKEIESLAVDPLDPKNLDKILWCVHGYDSHPSVHCLKIKTSPHISGHFVWGYSMWKREPGFRTLGISVQEFKGQKKLFIFFENKIDALEYLSIILEPKCS